MSDSAQATILIVDDDLGLLRLIERSLQREGLRTATCSSGNAAIAWLGRQSTTLLLLDLKLGDMGGKELITRLGEIGRPVPFIIMTGQGDERVAVEMMKRGALDYLVKDLSFVEFVPTVVRRALDQLEKERKLAEVEEARHSAEESLRLSEARFRFMADHAPVLIWMTGPDQLATWFNRPWLEFTGRSLEHELHQGWIAGIHPDDRERCVDAFTKAFARQSPFVAECRLRRHDGEWRWIYGQGVPLRGADGALTGYIGSCIDITERKALEREILEISEREQRRFGHDLHDSLGQRLTGLEMLSHALAEDLQGQAKELATQARRLNEELRETVTQARLISHSLAPVPLEGEGLMHALHELAVSTGRLAGVTCSFLCDSPVLVDDRTAATHLYRIAQEAVNNALKHGKARRIEIELTQQRHDLKLRVENNGQPMSATVPQKGGVGLNAMRYRADLIGARLSIESLKPKGVRVTCMLRNKS